MNLKFVRRAKKLTTLVIVSSILVLTLISILPCISVIETTSSGDTLVVYNIAKMEKSTDQQVNSIRENLELINICFWITAIFGMISLVGTIIYITEKYGSLAQLMMVIGCATIIFSILGTFLLWMLIKNIDSIASISAAAAFQNSLVTIKYAYFPLMVGAISAIGSAFYVIIVVLFSIKRVARSVEQRKTGKKKTKIAVGKPSAEKKQKSPEQKTTFAESIKTEKMSIPEINHELETPTEPEQPVRSEDQKKYFEFDKEQPKKPDSDEASSQSGTSKEAPKSPLFEKALTSVIEKRQPEVETENVEIKEGPIKTKVSVRCPQCKTVFNIEKGEEPANIECPNCGKKGVTS